MGNTHTTHTLPWNRPLKPTQPSAMFHALDVEGKHYLTLKDLMTSPSAALVMPHSLSALYFFDHTKDGSLTEKEFVSLVCFFHSEKRKVEEALSVDTQFRDLIFRASKAGVKDCSVKGRSSFRRISSYSNVRSVFSNRREATNLQAMNKDEASASTQLEGATAFSATSPRYLPDGTAVDRDASVGGDGMAQSPTSSLDSVLSGTESLGSSGGYLGEGQGMSESPGSSEPEREACHMKTISMYSSQSEFESQQPDCDMGKEHLDWRKPENRTALDAAVLENIMHANIQKLGDLLQTEGSREQFMAWLWNLANFNGIDVVTLEELRVFLAALSEDGIDLEALVFSKEVGVPLEESIINEFDTTHSGLLSRDEFMVLADLVTREYEFWKNRHLERIGDYKLGRTIGRGSSGVVRLAMHVETREKVAIKIIKKGKCSDLSRLDREIQSLMAAKHKHIVALEEVLDSKNNLFIVMELCGGGSLVDIVRLYPEERMPEETARFYMRPIFEALAFCHRNGICHRDIRLDNLLLDNDGNVKIADFGHSGIYTPGWDIFATSLVGSLYNLSPEQVLGNLYSGEKIDVWSAGVAVYCLLVGRPPFFDPEVTPLLERITTCDFETPDFLSPKASDLIRCMIREVPEERITMQQMLHHPWFYDGPEFGPSMNVVVIPVDPFFRKRPDVAEMIMAVTIYQHNLHFHLGDAENPASPEDHRGQEWTLKCLCPKNYIKFTISLFTKEPCVIKQKTARPLSAAASCSSLPVPPFLTQSPSVGLCRSDYSGRNESGLPRKLTEDDDSSSDTQVEARAGSSAMSKKMSAPSSISVAGYSSARPPLQKRMMKITPLNIAAHIRDVTAQGTCESLFYSALFDLELDERSRDASIDMQREEARSKEAAIAKNSSVKREERKRRKGGHSRSHSLKDPAFMRICRAETFEAFPYQKVYPQREMPPSVRHLNFDKPPMCTSFSSPEVTDLVMRDGNNINEERGSTQLYRFHRNATLNAVSSYNADFVAKPPELEGARGHDIALKLSRHPCKAVSPQLPQNMRTPHSPIVDGVDDLALTSAYPCAGSSEGTEKLTRDIANSRDAGGSSSQKEPIDKDEFQPYLEVRLSDGESGLFLQICRKLKNICGTKLAAAATRMNAKNTTREGLSGHRRTESSRGIDLEVSG